MFKKVFIDGEETPYSINEKGQLRNDKTGNFLKGTILHTYLFFNLRWNKRQKTKSCHRLVAETFLPNPDNLPFVHHIDGNRLNNNVDNLKWVTVSENCTDTNYHKSKDTESKNDIENEEWRYYKDTIYQASNFGRIKNTKTGRVSRGSKIDSGYYRSSIVVDNKRCAILMHRLVFDTFNPDTVYEDINHINGDKLDNRLCNLEGVSHRENLFKASRDTNAWGFRKVNQYDFEGNYIQTFPNASDAARAIGVLPGSLRNAIRLRGGKCKNYFFKWVENEEGSSAIRNGVEKKNLGVPDTISEDMVKAD